MRRMMISDSEYMHLYIMPIEKEKIQYSSGEYGKGKMSIELMQAIIGYVDLEIDKYKGLRVSWVGDDPLLAMNIVKYLSESLMYICYQHKKVLVADMTTNGYFLSLDNIKELSKYKICSYQINICADKSVYDDQRLMINGGNIYEEIVKNFCEIKRWRGNKNIRYKFEVLSEGADDSIKEYIYCIKELLLGDENFDLYALDNWERSRSSVSVSEKELVSYNTNHKNNVQPSVAENNKGYKLKKTKSNAKLVKPRRLVIGSDGVLYKCTAHYDDQRNKIGYVSKDGVFHWGEREYIDGNIRKMCRECRPEEEYVGRKCPYFAV